MLFLASWMLFGVCWGLPPIMPNIGYLATGYNIYYGNPLSTQAGVDEGFTKYAGDRIYDQTYNSSHTTGDERYALPDGFDALLNSGCSQSFSSSSTSKSSDYQSQLKASVTANVRYLTAAFEASADYNSFYRRTAESNERMVSSTAFCASYSASIDEYKRPPLSGDFEAAMSYLPADYGNGNDYFDFFDRYGTHAVMKATLGSRFGFTSYFSEEAWNTVQSTGVDVSAAASYQGMVSAGGTLNTNSQIKAQQAFKQSAQEFQLVTLGSKPVRGDFTAWMQQVIDEPMPIDYTLDSMCHLISDTTVQANCVKAQRPSEYCSKRVKGRGDIKDCSGAKDPACVWSRDCLAPSMACEKNECVTFHGGYLTFHGTYLAAFSDGSVGQSRALNANGVSFFTDGLTEDGKVSLKSSTGTYISARDDGSVGQANNWSGWESFTELPTMDGKVCLKTFQGTYITAGDDGSVGQTTNWAGWESFRKVYVAQFPGGDLVFV